jgi:hypothetical protein
MHVRPCYPRTGVVETNTGRVRGFEGSQRRTGLFRKTEASVSYNNLSAVVTYENTNSVLSSTHLPSIGRVKKPGEPGRSSLDTPGCAAPEGP